MKLHDNRNTLINAKRLIAVQDPEPAPRQIVVLNLILFMDFGPMPEINLTYKDLEKKEQDRAALERTLDPPAPKEISGPLQNFRLTGQGGQEPGVAFDMAETARNWLGEGQAVFFAGEVYQPSQQVEFERKVKEIELAGPPPDLRLDKRGPGEVEA